MQYSTAQHTTSVKHIIPAREVKNKAGAGAMPAYPSPASRKTPEQMLTVIAMALDMAPENYSLRSRERSIVELRFIGALFLRRNFPLITLQQIAAFFGGQDHSSVISGLTRAYDLISCRDTRFLQKYNLALQTINLWLKNED